MKTLIIDNYDSFTFNLAQLVAVVNQEEPIILANDVISSASAADLGSLRDFHFDNLIISPGPGHPGNEKDVGICRNAVLQLDMPILGVCLGMQIIAHVFGSEVRHAPEPFHGRLSRIFHQGKGLFVDFPNPFSAVRYHSLCAYLSSGSPLVETASIDSGLVMALEHRVLPIWGVQFHPESIATEHGVSLLKNFRDLSLKRIRRSRSFPSPKKSCRSVPGSKMSLCYRRIPQHVPSEDIFSQIFGSEQYAFWLDSSGGQGPCRFSFMGAVSQSRDTLCSYHSRSKELTLTSFSIGSEPKVERRTQSIFDWMDKSLGAIRVDRGNLPFDFCGGFVGYLGYELKGELGGEYQHDSLFPDAYLMYTESFIAIDHQERELYVVALADSASDVSLRLDEMSARVLQVVCRELRETPGQPLSCSAHDLSFQMSKEEYLCAIESALCSIRDGDTYQVCLTNQIYCFSKVDPLALYLVLRKHNPAPFSAFLRFRDLAVLSTSPERFLKIDEGGTVESKPIKGSSPRASDKEEDLVLAENLRSSEKNRAENLMIVDLLRNDLGRVSVPGSVTVPKLIEVESFATVHQLVSTVRSTLKEEFGPLDCIKAAFPGGSMTGAPKIRTMQILDKLETCARGIYSGALGYFSLNGSVDLSIVIRTIVAEKDRLSMGSGGGIVALSNGEDEYEEMLLKTKALVEAIEIYLGGHACE